MAPKPKEANVNYNGKPYRNVVMQVMTRDEFGRPKDVRLILEENSIEVDKAKGYIEGFILDTALAPKAKGDA